MLTLINVTSLVIFISCLLFAIVSRRINLPAWYEIILWIFIFGAIGLVLNSLFEPPYIENEKAEIILRFFGSIMVAGAVYERYKLGIKKGINE